MWTFAGFTLSMLIGSYFAGSIPLAFNFSEAKLKQVSVFGAGLLVGTALTVIIPEGVHAMYSDQVHAAQHAACAAGHSSSSSGGGPSEHAHHERPQIQPHHSAGAAGAAIAPAVPGAAAMRKIAEASVVVATGGKSAAAPLIGAEPAGHSGGAAGGADGGKGHAMEDVHQLIGLVLLLGFVFMLIVDQLMSKSRGFDKKMTATMGLVVHAAADGVALGAASSTSHLHVEFIVFLAIMLHKGPAAFGLVSFLLRDGVDRNRIRRHLLIFSIAAPLLAVFTYFGLSQRSKEHLDTMNGTGLAMLFSAGTFLYVATVHVLPELESKSSSCSSPSSGPGGILVQSEEHSGFSRLDLLLIVIGCCLPLVLSMGHHHH